MPAFNSQEILREHARRHNLAYTIQLQAVGHVPAVFVHELSVGDVLVWNYGATAKITAIEPVSAKFVKVTTRYKNRGMDTYSEYTQRMKLDRLVARVKPGTDFSRVITFDKILRGTDA